MDCVALCFLLTCALPMTSSHSEGPILCGFMVGDKFDVIQRGFDQFVGSGAITSSTGEADRSGVPKLRPEEVVVVLPDEETLFERGASREARPVDKHHARNCLQNYRELAARHNGRIREVKDIPSLAAL